MLVSIAWHLGADLLSFPSTVWKTGSWSRLFWTSSIAMEKTRVGAGAKKKNTGKIREMSGTRMKKKKHGLNRWYEGGMEQSSQKDPSHRRKTKRDWIVGAEALSSGWFRRFEYWMGRGEWDEAEPPSRSAYVWFWLFISLLLEENFYDNLLSWMHAASTHNSDSRYLWL